MVSIIDDGITYDDVLLVPKKTSISSRKDVNTKTRLSKRIELNIPIVAANMDTVTESAMAIAMAKEGGIGIIHRFMNIENQVEEVLKVKRSESLIIDKPYTLAPGKTLKDAKDFMDKNRVSGLLIVDDYSKLVGILTSRDMIFETDFGRKVSDVMTKDVISGKVGISLDEAKNILKKNKIEKLPIVDDGGIVKGLITSKDMVKLSQLTKVAKDKRGRLLVGAAVGVKHGFLERADALLDAGADMIVVDIAHGHSDLAINAIKALKKEFGDVEVMAGNVATADGTEDLISAGADSVKTGIGPGSNCSTRIVAGSGVPQLTAVIQCVEAAGKYDIPIVADGGVRYSGDLVKALAAGAVTFMIGGLLAGTEEAPGVTVMRNGRKYKVCRGMASVGASIEKQIKDGRGFDKEDYTEYVAEGVESFVPFKGKVSEVINQLVGGLKSGMSYSGAISLDELKKKATFIKISHASFKESLPHDVETIS